MNILVINGSPKGERSNTLRLTNAFLEGIICAAGSNSPVIEKQNISQMNITSCFGCFSCWKNTPGKCCIHDDMETVIEKLLWADLTIWSFPLYYFSLPGKLKTVIDRQLPMSLPFMVSDVEGGGHPSRYDMSGKRTVLISTCGFYTAESNYDSVTIQFDKICGKGNYTTLFCGEGELFRVPELAKHTDEYLSFVRQAGQEYASGGICEETNAKLKELIFPRDVFERMADASWGITDDGEKADSSLIFTKQMAALYNPAAYKGSDIILDMDYTDIGKRYRIILGKSESQITEQFTGKATTVIHTPLRVWQAIAAGEIEGSDALMQHLYSIEGDFDLLLQWDHYFGTGKKAEPLEKKQSAKEQSDMRYMLTAWIVFWIAVPIHSFYGSLISIGVSVCLPLLFYKNKRTVYDMLSGAIVSIYAIFLLLDFSMDIIIPLSYLSYGIMWSISAFFKVPLTAEYSMNNYGGESALRNPIFLRTNRILTVAWGILYLFTPIWTYVIMRMGAGIFVSVINSILPMIMGVFTLWFQKWYPKKVAQGKF